MLGKHDITALAAECPCGQAKANLCRPCGQAEAALRPLGPALAISCDYLGCAWPDFFVVYSFGAYEFHPLSQACVLGRVLPPHVQSSLDYLILCDVQQVVHIYHDLYMCI